MKYNEELGDHCFQDIIFGHCITVHCIKVTDLCTSVTMQFALHSILLHTLEVVCQCHFMA